MDPKADIRNVLERLRKGDPAAVTDNAEFDPAIVYAWRFQAAIAQAKMGCVEELAAYIDERLAVA